MKENVILFILFFLLIFTILFIISYSINYFLYRLFFKGSTIKFKELFVKSRLYFFLWVLLLSIIPFLFVVLPETIYPLGPLFFLLLISLSINYRHINKIKPLDFKGKILYNASFIFHGIISIIVIFFWLVAFTLGSIG